MTTIAPPPAHTRLRARLRGLAWAMPWLTALWLLLVPTFLITTNVRVAFASPSLYVWGFDRYDVSTYTGIPRPDLVRIAGELRDYFRSDEEYLAIRVRLRGAEHPLFNEREVEHMRDVKTLVNRVATLNMLASLYLAGFVAAGFWLSGRGFARRLARLLMLGGLTTVGLVVLAGLAFVVAFDQVFLLFHQLSFANDFWQLDPSRDYLVALFPQGFWFDATMLIVGGAVVEAGALAGLGGGLSYFVRTSARWFSTRGQTETS